MMKPSGRDDEEDIESMSPSASLLANSSKKDGLDIPDIPFCGCLSVRFYQPYFDIDTSDVFARIAAALFYCRRESTFLTSFSDKPDAYGPFWISSTLIFIIAVSSHMNGFFTSWITGASWAYDFKAVVTACSVIYGFAAFVPALIWFALRQYEANVSLVTLVCVYGYSLFVFIPASILCIYPSNLLAWLVLFGAGLISSHFLLRNVGPLFVTHTKQEAMIFIGILGAIQVILSLTLKLSFFYGTN